MPVCRSNSTGCCRL